MNLETASSQANDFRAAVAASMMRDDVHRAVREIYAALQREIDQRKPRCASSGRCCRFEEYGHRLFVTTIELATFLYDLPGLQSGRSDAPCPFQVDGLCSVHSIRPFGCRIFFCDPSSEAWQQAQYEKFHADLKRAHEKFDVPYFYVEWRQALASLQGLIPAPAMQEGQSSATNQKPPVFRLSLPQHPF